jgi:hypothetical protein
MQTIMPTARDTRRGAPLFPAPPTAAPPRETWPRWLGFNLWLFACLLVGVAAALVAISALAGANDGDDAPWIAYAWMCLFLPFTWPLYMAALAIVARRVRHPRRWAIALTPLLFALFPYAIVTFVVPGIAASWIAYWTYGAIVRLPPGSQAGAGPARD